MSWGAILAARLCELLRRLGGASLGRPRLRGLDWIVRFTHDAWMPVRAQLTSFRTRATARAATSTAAMALEYFMRVGPITPTVPVLRPSK